MKVRIEEVGQWIQPPSPFIMFMNIIIGIICVIGLAASDPPRRHLAISAIIGMTLETDFIHHLWTHICSMSGIWLRPLVLSRGDSEGCGTTMTPESKPSIWPLGGTHLLMVPDGFSIWNDLPPSLTVTTQPIITERRGRPVGGFDWLSVLCERRNEESRMWWTYSMTHYGIFGRGFIEKHGFLPGKGLAILKGQSCL